MTFYFGIFKQSILDFIRELPIYTCESFLRFFAVGQLELKKFFFHNFNFFISVNLTDAYESIPAEHISPSQLNNRYV